MKVTKYIKLIKTTILSDVEYRIYIILLFLLAILQMFILAMLWSAIFSWNNVETIAGFTLSEMITYAIVAVFISQLWWDNYEYNIADFIKNGGLTTILTRPIDFFFYTFSHYAGENLNTIIYSFIAWIIAIFVFNIRVPIGITLLLFTFSLLISFIIMFTICMIIGCFAFWTEDIYGISGTIRIIILLFSGSFIPLSFFPEGLKIIASILPFQAMYSLPILIYLEKITGTDIFIAILIQIFWAIVLYLVARLFLKYGLKRFTSLGG
jgi:ABC-2 type transport system permease protein